MPHSTITPPYAGPSTSPNASSLSPEAVLNSNTGDQDEMNNIEGCIIPGSRRRFDSDGRPIDVNGPLPDNAREYFEFRPEGGNIPIIRVEGDVAQAFVNQVPPATFDGDPRFPSFRVTAMFYGAYRDTGRMYSVEPLFLVRWVAGG